jgi:predicted permease
MRFYKLFLRAYPASFRNEYGDEMCAIFARRLREASGPTARAALWAFAPFETICNAAAVHADILRQDLRYTARSLVRSPGFAFTAIAVLALGIGANTAAFSITDHVLIRALPFPDSDRLVNLWEAPPGYSRVELSPANYRDWKNSATVFESMGAHTNISANLVGQGEPERLDGAMMTSEVIPALGVSPLIGRTFTDADTREGAPSTVLLSYDLWQIDFGGDPGVLGRRVLLNDQARSVIGVMPRDFRFPDRQARFWMPLAFKDEDYRDRDNLYLHITARLKRDVSIQTARAEMSVIAARLASQYPDDNAHVGAVVIPLRDDVSRQSRMLVLALAGAALGVLLIACTNLANLLLGRALSRRHELAVRTAIGAGRDRLVRQLITESLLLAISGGGCGVALAIITVPLLARLVPMALPVASAPSVDLRVLLASALLTLITGITFGAAPAWRACNTNLDSLREGPRPGAARRGFRRYLIVIEVAASVVLLVGTGLLLRALWRIRAVDPGFRAESVLTLRTALPLPKYEPTLRRVQFYDRVLEDIRRLPGVSGAAYISFVPMAMGGGIWGVGIPGQTTGRAERQNASSRFVTPGFFAALDIPLLAGRDVSESDTLNRPFVAVVSRSFVRRYWQGSDALGRHFDFGGADRTIVGVVGDIRVRGPERDSEPQVYLPYRQVEDGWFSFFNPKDLVVRCSGNGLGLVSEIRRIIRAADPQQPVSDVRLLSDIIDSQTASRSVQVMVLAGFATIAFLLAAVGLHGVLSFAVSSRSREIGVRVALGAQRGDVLGMVFGQSARLLAVGLAIGLVLAWWIARLLESLLAGIKPSDPTTFVAAAALCILMTLLGSLVPAARALRIDPIAAIRSE